MASILPSLITLPESSSPPLSARYLLRHDRSHFIQFFMRRLCYSPRLVLLVFPPLPFSKGSLTRAPVQSFTAPCGRSVTFGTETLLRNIPKLQSLFTIPSGARYWFPGLVNCSETIRAAMPRGCPTSDSARTPSKFNKRTMAMGLPC